METRFSILRVFVVALLVAAAAAPGAALAQKKGAPAQKNAPQGTLSVSIEQALYLIRSTLLTLNDANRTGNYTVLRDLAAPGFQARNTAADLAQIFADLRRRNSTCSRSRSRRRNCRRRPISTPTSGCG